MHSSDDHRILVSRIIINNNILVCDRNRLVIIFHDVRTGTILFSVLALLAQIFLDLVFHKQFLVVIKIVPESHSLVAMGSLNFAANFLFLGVYSTVLGSFHRSDCILSLSDIRWHLTHLPILLLHAISRIRIIMLILGHTHVDPHDIFKVVLNAHHLTFFDRNLLFKHLVHAHDPHLLIIEFLIFFHQCLKFQFDSVKLLLLIFELVFNFSI